MKRLAWHLIAVTFLSVTAAAQSSPEFFPEDFGAVSDDGLDDRASLQAALDAAAAAGNGTVRLSAGVYHVLVRSAQGLGPVSGYSYGSGGYEGITVPPGCTLTGAGPDLTFVSLLAGTGNANSIGVGIVNGGYRTALTDFGAGGGIRISNLHISTPDTGVSPTGNLIGLAHADGVVISNVNFGSSRAHALEINLSRNITVDDCLFDGRHFSASTLQFDIGLFGPKSLRPKGTVLSDIIVRRCHFTGRDDDANVTTKVIELSHSNSTCILRNAVFEDCIIESLPHYTALCVAPDNPPAQEISGLRFERCHFVGRQTAPSLNGLLQLAMQGTQILQDITIRDCRFSGHYTHGAVIVSAFEAYTGGWASRRRILIEGNTFAPTLDRAVPTSYSMYKLLSVVACNDAVIRKNLFEIPATAQNLTLSHGVVCCHAANNLDLTVEDNVFTWAHPTQATAPAGWSRHFGLWTPVSLLEQNGVAARQHITGNAFLYPVNGINYAMIMQTNIPTTSWPAGAPRVGGLIAGNFASGAGTASPWSIHWDLSGAGNISQLRPASPADTRATGWYETNGADLTTLGSGNNRLPQLNAVKAGYATHLPSIPATVIRLHGPMTGEGLLAENLSRYTGSTYRGTLATPASLAALPLGTITPKELRVVRQPLTVFHWEADLLPELAPADAVQPVDKTPGAPGCWVPLQCCTGMLASNADADGDGLNTLMEMALMRDPLASDSQEALAVGPGTSPGEMSVRFRCASGPNCPRLSLLSTTDLKTWTTLTTCQPGGVFSPPPSGTLTETPYLNGREIILSAPVADRCFWKLIVEP